MTKPTGRPKGRPKTHEYSTLMARVPQELVARTKRYAGLKRQTISEVLRDALELLLEEERYQPFASDRNGDAALVSDRNGDAVASPMSDIVSDANGEGSDRAQHASPFLSDAKEDTNEEGRDQDVQEPVIMSDTKGDFDTTKYFLGKLCKVPHDYHGTGHSLRSWKKRECQECGTVRSRESRQRKHQAATATP